MRTDRKGIPKDMKELGNCEEKPTELCYSEYNKILFTSYVDKKPLKRKMLFYSQQTVRVTRDIKKQYNIIIRPQKVLILRLDIFKIVTADEIKTAHTECISFFQEFSALLGYGKRSVMCLKAK